MGAGVEAGEEHREDDDQGEAAAASHVERLEVLADADSRPVLCWWVQVASMLDKLEVDIEKVETTIGDKLHMLDKDKDGVLSTAELTEVRPLSSPTHSRHIGPTPANHRRLTCGSTSVVVCVLQVIQHVLKRHTSEEEALKIAAMLDKDADGVITVQVRQTPLIGHHSRTRWHRSALCACLDAALRADDPFPLPLWSCRSCWTGSSTVRSSSRSWPAKTTTTSTRRPLQQQRPPRLQQRPPRVHRRRPRLHRPRPRPHHQPPPQQAARRSHQRSSEACW